jgi:hypothetical protein
MNPSGHVAIAIMNVQTLVLTPASDAIGDITAIIPVGRSARP